MKKCYYVLISITLLLIVWLFFSLKIDNPIILPNPIVVLKQVVFLLTDLDSILIILRTLIRLIISLTSAVILGGILGLLGGLNEKVDLLLRPLITSIRALPVVSIIIVILIWFGYQKAPYIITIFVILPLIYQSIVSGITSIDSDYKDVIELYAKGHPSLVKEVYLPMISPFLFSAIIQSLGLGIKVLVMSEMLSQTSNSIGYVIYLEKLNLNIDTLFAWTIILIIIVSVIEVIINKFKVTH